MLELEIAAGIGNCSPDETGTSARVEAGPSFLLL